MNDLPLSLAICVVVCLAVALGPTRVAVRAVLRQLMQPPQMRRWQYPATIGYSAGAVFAVALSGVLVNAPAAIFVAVLGLLALLAVMDFAWRWLPFIWTSALSVLGAVDAWIIGDYTDAFGGAIIGAGTLLALQLYFRLRKGIVALGTGDIWLAMGLGILAGSTKIGLILGVAALTALATEGIKKTIPATRKRKRLGVAYGAHLCLAYLVFIPL